MDFETKHVFSISNGSVLFCKPFTGIWWLLHKMDDRSVCLHFNQFCCKLGNFHISTLLEHQNEICTSKKYDKGFWEGIFADVQYYLSCGRIMGESEKFQQYADVIYGWSLTHIFLTQFGNKIARIQSQRS